MGTRNLTIVKSKGKVKVAQYCQWDGYPTGQGETISNFLRDKKNIEKLNTEIQTVEFISHEEENKLWQSLGADDSGLVGIEVSDKFKEKYPDASNSYIAFKSEQIHILGSKQDIEEFKKFVDGK